MTHAELLAAGCDASPEAYARLAAFVAALEAECQKLNLTAIRTAPEIWRRHVCDSVAAAPLLVSAEARRVVDVGTGGGVPGLPLACVLPDVQFTLIDGTKKKLDAVARMVAAIGLTNVRTQWGRGEQLMRQRALRGRFDFVLARAVGRLATLIPATADFAGPDGQCCYWKSTHIADELAEAAPVARRARLDEPELMSYRIPGDTEDRALVIYARAGLDD